MVSQVHDDAPVALRRDAKGEGSTHGQAPLLSGLHVIDSDAEVHYFVF